MKHAIALVLMISAAAGGCNKKQPVTGAGSASGAASGATPEASATAGPATGASGAGAAPEAAGSAAWTAEPDPLAQAQAAAAADTAALVAKKPPVLGVIDAVVAAHRAASREAWDPAAVVAAVGRDRGKLFAWVRDRTALVPYRGSLRGAVGVMMDRVGNSLDRSLLLAELLAQAGLEVRLASAQLDAGLAGKLVAAWATRPRPALPTAKLDDAALIASLGRIAGVDPAALAAKLAKEAAARAAIADRTRTRIASQAKALAALVAAPAPGAPAPPAAAEAYADHWWVQVHDGEAWSDLDPALPTAAPGEALAASATETLAAGDLGDDRRHTLAIRVIGEVWRGDAPEDVTLVEHAFAPSQFYGQKLAIRNVPLDMPDDHTVLTAKDPPAALRTALVAQSQYAPVILLGGTPVVHLAVNDRGETLDLTSGDANTIGLARTVQHATQDGVGGATDLLGDLPSGEPAGGAAAAPLSGPRVQRQGFTAEYLEIEIRTPGAPARVVRRTIFDTLGAGDRAAAPRAPLSGPARLDRALALVAETELLPLFAQLPEAFVIDRTVRSLDAARDAIAALAARKNLAAVRAQVATLAPIPGPLYGLALARFADRPVYLDRLDVLAFRHRAIARPAAIALREQVDILANDVAVWPTAGDARAARIAQGVADTALEGAIVATCAAPGCLRAPSTSEWFAGAGGRGWAVVAEPQGPAAADRAAGYAIVAPGAAPASWWRIDAASGETLGMSPLGGSEGAEQVAIQKAMTENSILGFASLARCLYGNITSTAGADDTFNATVVCVASAAVGWAGSNVVALSEGSRALGLAIQIIASWMT
jgi:hypothetical protein